MSRVANLNPAEHVLEVVTPRTNTARLSSAEHLFGSLVVGARADGGAVALETVGDAEQRRFLVRTTSAAELRRVSGQLGAAYPQAILRPFDAATLPNGDPAQAGPDEQVATITLRLRVGEHLPLRTFEDRELDTAGHSVQVDPLLAFHPVSPSSLLAAGAAGRAVRIRGTRRSARIRAPSGLSAA